ncbi:hypothetical protein D041_0490A, partial [Vibrio parahaemolyticus EKP-008]
MATVQFFTTF